MISGKGLGDALTHILGWVSAIMLTGMVIFLAGFMVFIGLVLATPKLNPQTQYKTDAIIVLTGGPHRIEAGLRLFAQRAAPKLFVSGVFDGATKQDLIAQNISDPALRIALNGMDLHGFEVGNTARTTEQNADEIKDWLALNPSQNIVLITAENHMIRSKILLKRSLPNIHIQSLSVVRHSGQMRDMAFWKDSFIEYSKTLFTLLQQVPA